MDGVCRDPLTAARSFALKRFVLRLRWLFIFGFVFLVIVNIASADTHKAERSFVYGINAAIATGYTGAFVPPSIETIYLRAGTTNILSPRITEIYFWPITNEYKARWDLINEPVPGKLEILRNGTLVQSLTSGPYTLQSRSRGSDTDTQLITGDEALEANTRFIGLQKAFGEASYAYYEAQQKWLAAVNDINAQELAGDSVVVPPQPRQPEPIAIYSNGVSNGFSVNLIAGTYQIQLRAPDNTIVSGGTRTLEVFEARQNAIGYKVLPETRWTTPDQILDPGDAIIGLPNSQLYLIPYAVTEYPALPYSLLQSPQQQFPAGADWLWVLGVPLNDASLLVSDGGSAAKQLKMSGYRVEQQSGVQLGYSVKPFVLDSQNPSRTPDISGFSVRLGRSGTSFTVTVLASDGAISPGSTRSVRVSYPPRLIPLLIPTLAPIVIGVSVIRRRTTTEPLLRK